MNYTHLSKADKNGEESALNIVRGEESWLMTVRKNSTDQVSIDILGSGVTSENADWILREISLLLPPSFADYDEHEGRVKETV